MSKASSGVQPVWAMRMPLACSITGMVSSFALEPGVGRLVQLLPLRPAGLDGLQGGLQPDHRLGQVPHRLLQPGLHAQDPLGQGDRPVVVRLGHAHTITPGPRISPGWPARCRRSAGRITIITALTAEPRRRTCGPEPAAARRRASRRNRTGAADFGQRPGGEGRGGRDLPRGGAQGSLGFRRGDRRQRGHDRALVRGLPQPSDAAGRGALDRPWRRPDRRAGEGRRA